MEKLQRSDLYSLEQYAEKRPEFRSQVMQHKKNRILHVGPVATLYFEDRQTIQYQVQEMLRVERIFEVSGIGDELATYNPLIPDGSNWKATFMIEEPDAERRKHLLGGLVGIENRVWVRIGGHKPVFAIADEDLDRTTGEKTSSVHFLRFELDAKMTGDAKAGAEISIGIDHDNYTHKVSPLPANIRTAILADLD